MERVIRCPACKKPVEPRALNPAFPFCSPRCRQVDLGRWLGEEYRVPERPAEGEEHPPGSEDGSGSDA
jgi:endogenous inhibitor of DNA gyrase (YacG/DUF329 family)